MTRVLVVDDEEIYRHQLTETLSSDGSHVATAANGREAVDIGARYRPDVLVIDWMLKDHIHGLHVVQTLRAVTPDLQSILITGFPSDDLRHESDQLNIADFIEKPFKRERVLDAVQRALRCPGTLHHQTPLAVLEVDADATVLFANPLAKTMLKETKIGSGAMNLESIFQKNGVPNLDEAVSHGLVVYPRSEPQVTWRIRSQNVHAGQSRLIIVQRRSDPPHTGHPFAGLLLGLREPKKIVWPFDGRVLIVDDQATRRRMYVTMLETAGAGCYAVKTTREAVRLIQEDGGIEFVVFDDGSLKTSAAETITGIRSTGSNALIVGTSHHQHRKELAALEVDHYLPQPWTVKTLVETILGKLGSCVECGLELPLRRPTPGEPTSGWSCAFCNSHYRAVFDECASDDTIRNVLAVDKTHAALEEPSVPRRGPRSGNQAPARS